LAGGRALQSGGHSAALGGSTDTAGALSTGRWRRQMWRLEAAQPAGLSPPPACGQASQPFDWPVHLRELVPLRSRELQLRPAIRFHLPTR